MELIEIVDKNGEKTGEIIDKELAHERNLLHNEVACLIINDKGEVLLQRRSASKKFSPNKYSLCAGHVDAGETLKSAMIREIKEELGVTVKSEDLHSYLEKEVKIKKTNSHITYYYYTILNLKEEDFKIQEEELSEVKWFTVEKIIDMLKNHDDDIAWDVEKISLYEGIKSILKNK